MTAAAPTTFLAIDPGFAKSNGTGWALFHETRLHAIGLADSDEPTFEARVREICAGIPAYQPQPHRVIEHMKIYPGPQQKGDQNDLLNLAFLEGALALAAPSFELVTARSWKGNAPKGVVQERIARRFAPGTDEGRVLEEALLKIRSAEKRGSLIEAAGLGLWRVGRLG